jgi:glycosyltransferase involved in cell wall biosynthesis
MKIAVVGPSPVPYTIGGMEKLLWQMTEKINQLTSHQAEIIKLPSREDSFWSLLDSYYAFWKLDLSHFDMVISTKYPSWMISHPNHICYMIHKLRGLYDTYHLTGLPREVNNSCTHTKKLLEFLDSTWNKPDIKQFWEVINEYRTYGNKIPADSLTFPGPLIRKIIHYLDNGALASSCIKRYYTMSQTVANREGYFPGNVKVVIANPPSANDSIGNITYGNYFFTVSRLDNAKRVNLLVEAMKEIKYDVRLVIAGAGSDEDRLKYLARSDERIEFRGFCSDEEVANLYANCLAVLYVPYEEDYGLVTVESFLRSKPVITCSDSGGTTEFVIDGENGFVVPPNSNYLAKRMRYLYDNREEAMIMGASGLQRIKSINWTNFIRTLIPGSVTVEKPVFRRIDRRKILVTSTFPIYPPRGGGQSRVYNLYKNLAKYYDIEILSFANYDQPSFNEEIAPGLREMRFPKSNIHQEKEWEIEKRIGVPITDVAMPVLSKFTPEYGEMLRQKAENTDIIVLSHPYLFDEISAVGSRTRLIYEAQDVEYDLKSKVLPPMAKEILDDVYRIEKSCCENSKLVMTCSEEDANRLVELYGADINKFVIVPNGVDINSVPYVSWSERKDNKRRLGLEDQFLVLFMGSWHPPNLEACREIFKIAKQLPEVKFLLLGSQCLAFQDQSIPANVGLLGVVDEDEKNLIFSVVDLALNPMLSGSGTNLKMFDYMAAGIPVISTEFGVRGIDVFEGEHLLLCNNEKMLLRVREFLSEENEFIEKRVTAAFSLIKNKYVWEEIVSQLVCNSAFKDKILF